MPTLDREERAAQRHAVDGRESATAAHARRISWSRGVSDHRDVAEIAQGRGELAGGTFAAQRRPGADEQDLKGRVDRQRQAPHAPVAGDHVRERGHLRTATQYPPAEDGERAADRWSERSALGGDYMSR